jgi:Glyoxalase/Bleomycin resistance protein/Dioxygenase superfamily
VSVDGGSAADENFERARVDSRVIQGVQKLVVEVEDCNELSLTYDELRARGIAFPQPPVEESFGRWSLFRDNEGNRFALQPREF